MLPLHTSGEFEQLLLTCSEGCGVHAQWFVLLASAHVH